MNKLMRVVIALAFLTTWPMGSLYAAENFSVQYRALERASLSDKIHAEIVVKNVSGSQISLNEMQFSYQYTLEGSAEFSESIPRALIIGADYHNITSEVHIGHDKGKFVFGFPKSVQVVKPNELVLVQFIVQKTDGSQFSQLNDLSFNADADFLTPTTLVNVAIVPRMQVKGIVLDEENAPIAMATVLANGVSTSTSDSGEFDLLIKEADSVKFVVSKDGYADGFDEVEADELGDLVSESFGVQMFLKKWDAQASIDPRFGGSVETIDGVVINFPPSATLSSTFNVGLTSIYSADSGALSDIENYEGFGATIGSVALQFFHAIDVVIADIATGERITLAGYNPPIEIKIKTSCSNASLSPLATWYLDEASGIWKEHDQPAIFVPADRYGRCYFRFTVNHFTKYAIARAYTGDFGTLNLRFTPFVLVPPKDDIPILPEFEYEPSTLPSELLVKHASYVLEIENSVGVLHRAVLSTEALANYSIEGIPTDRDVFIRITDSLGYLGAGLRLTNMPEFTGTTRYVTMPSLSKLVWRPTWVNRDRPSGNGDYEIFETESYYCETPFSIKAREVGTVVEHESSDTITDEIDRFDRNYGFTCVNASQPDSNMCKDYEIKLRCPSILTPF